MRFAASWILALVSPPSPVIYHQQQQVELLLAGSSHLSEGVSQWIAAAAPSKADIQLLRQAFAEFYGVERDLEKSESLLSQVVELWQQQPPDELAGLYRVRGDCYTLMANAAKATADYTKAIELIRGPEGDKADPSELPAALLGRARALKAQGSSLSVSQAKLAAQDYRDALILSSREEWDTEQELLEDGATRNPFAAWEMGSVLRQADEWSQASKVHAMASVAFDEIGDKSRSAISLIDAGIDLAGAGQIEKATALLSKAVSQTKGIEARDVGLLQRVIAKEGEGRMALAALQWDAGERQDAEGTLGKACERLEQMQVDAAQRRPANVDPTSRLLFSIDDSSPAVGMSCSRFKNPTFLTEQLGWTEPLQKKMIKLQTLK